jgi:GSH-dependent disulfide-bond oxidoreductase
VIKFYYSLAPNPRKVALLLEELGLAYEPIPVDTRKGEQHLPAFTRINPNAKVPVIVDGDTVVFDSSAILLYLAEKSGRFLSRPESRGQMLSWLMFTASGIGPFTGQCVHFRNYAPEKIPYAVNRYELEARRHWTIIEQRLDTREWMLDETYTLLDMAVWGWARTMPFALGDDVWQQFPRVKRFVDTIDAGPAAQRALAMKELHAFKTDMDDTAWHAMFPHIDRTATGESRR